MNEKSGTCYTLDAALEKAVDLENRIFNQFVKAIRMVKQEGARGILQDAASEELKHKQQLERALIEGRLGDLDTGKPVPTMNLDHRFGVDNIDRAADSRTALAHAIHLINFIR